MVIVSGTLTFFGVFGFAYLFYKLRQNHKETAVVDYPAYGVVGPVNPPPEPTDDEKMTRKAHMLVFQHQKQKQDPIPPEKPATRPTVLPLYPEPDSDDDDENQDIVYECSGLAPAGEMVVKNPMFDSMDEPSPNPPKSDSNHS